MNKIRGHIETGLKAQYEARQEVEFKPYTDEGQGVNIDQAAAQADGISSAMHVAALGTALGYEIVKNKLKNK